MSGRKVLMVSFVIAQPMSFALIVGRNNNMKLMIHRLERALHAKFLEIRGKWKFYEFRQILGNSRNFHSPVEICVDLYHGNSRKFREIPSQNS